MVGPLVTPQKPEYTRSVRVAIITDLGYGDPDEEVAAIVDILEGGLEANVKVVVHGRGMHVVSMKTFDLLVLDYGGASIAGGTSDLAAWQIRAACEWADGHPGKMLLLWTGHTSLEYGNELEGEFGHLSNVLFRFGTKPWDMNIDNSDVVFDDLRKWLWPDEE